MKRLLLISLWLLATVLTTQANSCSEPSECLERRGEINADWEGVQIACYNEETRNDNICSRMLHEAFDDEAYAKSIGCNIN